MRVTGIAALLLFAACAEGPTATERPAAPAPAEPAKPATPAPAPVPATLACDLRPAFERPDEGGSASVAVFEGDPIPALGGIRPLAFATTLKVNTDGTRISYHRDDPRGKTRAINDIRNAMRRGTIADFEAVAANDWQPLATTWSLLSDNVIEKDASTGKPCVTGDGFLVSMTADVAVPGGFNRQGDCDQTKWIDALDVPGLVLPGGANQFRARQARPRSPVAAFALADPSHRSFGIVGDTGPADEIGEANVAMNRDLNGLPAAAVPSDYDDAKARFQAPASLVLVFPGDANRAPRPLTGTGVGRHAEAAFQAWGGEARLATCLPLFR